MDLLDDLRLFIDIAEHGNMSAVARERSVSPSTVTLGLQRLEDRVGTQLVTRSTRHLCLTPEGEIFLCDCRRILSDLDDSIEKMMEQGALTGQLKLTATNDFGREYLAQLVHKFMKLHPGIEVDLYLTDGVVNLIECGLDLGLRTGPLEDSRLRAKVLLNGTYTVSAAPEYWKTYGKPEHPRDLIRHNCIVLNRPGAPLRNWRFQENGQYFTVKVKGNRIANDGRILRQWAVAGAGVVIKPSWDIQEDLKAGRLETALDQFKHEAINLYAVYPEGRATRRLRVFVDYLSRELSVLRQR